MDQPPRPGSPPRRQRACEPCTRAKARCNFRDENATRHLCDRCERLKITCSAKTTKSVRRPRQLKPLVNRVASLEQQIASLVTTERTRNARPQAGHGPTSTSSSSSNSTPPELYGRETRCDDAGESWPGSDGQVCSDAELPVSSTRPPLGLTWARAAFVLNDFRALFMPNFPFVVVDPGTTPQQLLREKPFLFRAIMLVAAPLPPSRTAKMQRQVLAYLGQRMLLEEEETLELLQGILIIIMWADTKYFYDKQITRLVYAALGYAHSLGITKVPLSVLEEHGSGADQPDDCFSSKVAANLAKHHTLEEQRAFLGCFYAVTVNSNQFSRRNPLLQQPGAGGSALHVDVCCENLTRSGRGEDATAAGMVRLAQASGRIAEIFGSLFNRATGESYATLFEGQAVAVRGEVDKIADEIDPHDPHFAYLWMHYNAVLVQLYEPATRAATSSPLHRKTCLLDCLAAARAYYDVLAALPPERFLYRTSANISHAQMVVTVTTRLLVLEDEGWDLESARASLDFLDVAERLMDLFRRTVAAGRERMRRFADETGAFVAGEEGDGESQTGMCEGLVEKMVMISDWYRSRIRTTGAMARGEAVDTDLMEGVSRIWHWPSDASGFSFFAGLLNPLDVSYEGI